MKHLITFVVLIMICASAHAQSRITGSQAQLERSQAYQEKNISATDAKGNVYYKSRADLDEAFKVAAKHYREGNYEQALPIVQELSQWGVKGAQAILGGMYIQGYHVDQSVTKGLAWLGVAKEGRAEKAAAKTFDHVYKQLNADQQKYIDGVVAQHIDKFGKKAQNLRCTRSLTVGSNQRIYRCKKIPGRNSTLYDIS